MIQDIYPHKLNNHYRTDARPDASSIILYFTKDGILNCLKNQEELVDSEQQELFSEESRSPTQYLSFPRLEELTAISPICTEELTYLFSIDKENYFLLEETPERLPDDYVFTPVRSLRKMDIGPKYQIFASVTGLQLYHWYQNNRFCGRCGHKTVHHTMERALECPSCGHIIYPRIVPAVIVGVRNKDKLLLTKYRTGFAHYALVAGFTEIGETLEETVAREVMEETGLHVKNICYYKSQPWGIVDDLLAGFYCDVDGDTEIHMDPLELKFAEWCSRDEIMLQPDDFSLTNEMMKMFKDGRDSEG